MHTKALQSCPTLCDPMDSSPQAPLSTGFSRQEYWSGLPFPSPVNQLYFDKINLQKVQIFCCKISHGEVIYTMVTVINNTISHYLKVAIAKRVEPESSHHKRFL